MTREDRQLIILKRIVKIMGIILIVGTFVVLSLAIGRLVSKSKSSSPSNIATSCDWQADKSAESMTFLEDRGTNISNMQLNGNLAIITLNNEQRSKIIILDICSGEKLREIIIK